MSDTNSTPYVFISYAHKDAAVVLPCIEALKRKNINVWFDEGIQAGSEWPEYIAEKVFFCAKFVTFISRAYLESQNCKRELNFAISKKKDLLSVFIEDVELSLGVEMQLGTYQSIFRDRFADDAEFHQSLGNEQWFAPCKTGPSQNDEQAAASSFRESYSDIPRQNASKTGAEKKSAAASARFTPQPASTVVRNTRPRPSKNRFIAALLALVFGMFGVHYFYLGNKKKGLLYLAFFWTYIPIALSIFTGFRLLFMSNQKFKEKYNC